MTLIISKPHLCTHIPIFYPKYNTDGEDWEVWISVKKVTYASPVILVIFTRAKHLAGQRFAVRKDVVMKCEKGTNGKIPVYMVEFSKLEAYETAQEVRDLAEGLYE